MADNLTTPVAAGTVLAAKDLGTKLLPLNGISDQAGADAMGLVTASPAANTLLGRLKDIATALVGIATDATLTAISAKLPATLGAKTGAASLSVVPASDAGLATAAKQDTAQTTLANILSALLTVEPATVYVPVTLGPGALSGGACRAIVCETAGRVKLKQPDGTVRDNFPLFAGVNPVSATMIDVPGTGTSASGVWAEY